MLIRHKNDPGTTSHHAGTRVPEGTVKRVHTELPVLALQVGTDVDPGLRRKHDPNEDTLFVTHGTIPSVSSVPTPFALFAVADGMGGHAHGQEASRLAVDTLARSVCGFLSGQQRRPDAFLPGLIEGVRSANQAVYQRNQGQRTNMGTTMTAALVINTMRSLIYRSLGEKATVEVDGSSAPLSPGDILLLCSDGLWEMVRDPQIAAILSEPASNPSRTAHALIEGALAGGGGDNVSAIVVKVNHA